MTNDPINVWSYLEQYSEDENEIIEIVKEVFRSGKLILGENVSMFEILSIINRLFLNKPQLLQYFFSFLGKSPQRFFFHNSKLQHGLRFPLQHSCHAQ